MWFLGFLVLLLTNIVAAILNARYDVSPPTFHLRTEILSVCVLGTNNVCVKCLICKWDANRPYQSVLSHLEKEVEIIHDSCQLSLRACQICVERWLKRLSLIWVEKRGGIHAAFFCYFSFLQLRILFPARTLVSLIMATRSCPRGCTCPASRSPLFVTRVTSSLERLPLNAS